MTTRRQSMPLNKLSPIRGRAGRNDNRFKTPMKDREGELLTNDPLRYLNTVKNQKKETPRDYVVGCRKILHTNILTEDRERELFDIAERFEDEKEKLELAREAFEEDLQRFRSMKGELEQ